MTIEAQNTGYPAIDRPWLKYYSNDAKNAALPEGSIYDVISTNSQSHSCSVAIEYYGAEITYSEFLQRIDAYAAALYSQGIRKSDAVSIIAPNLPETFYSIYAINKIGAVSNLIDPRNNPSRIKQYIEQSNAKSIIMLDIVYPKVKEIIEETKITQVYTISASDSLPFPLRLIQKGKTGLITRKNKLPGCPQNPVYRRLSKVVEDCSDCAVCYPKMSADDPAVIINTSGTTGEPKGVVLTNGNLNAVAYDYMYSGMEYKPGDGFLGIMPCFLAYGMGVGTHMTFALGLKNIIIPSLKSEDFPKLIRKHRPEHFAGVPTHYQYLVDSPKMKAYDLSFIKTAAAGGDAMNSKLKQRANTFLEERGCKSRIKVGYGCTENTGIAASQFYVGESTSDNELSTVGIPALFTDFSVISPSTGERLKYNETGEILLSGEGVMQGYIGNEAETGRVIETIDGTRYLHTGDLGRIDENGCVYIVGRIKRIIVRPDGHNVFPLYIENTISKHEAVKSCACAGAKDKYHINGEIPVAFVQLKEHGANIPKIEEELKSLSLQELPERDVALDYMFVDEIPLTENGKVDYPALLSQYVNSFAGAADSGS